MTIWVNKKTGETKNQYTQPLPSSDWERKKEGFSPSSDDGSSDMLNAIVGIGILSSVFDSPSPSYDPSPSFDGGGGDFGGGGAGGDY